MISLFFGACSQEKKQEWTDSLVKQQSVEPIRNDIDTTQILSDIRMKFTEINANESSYRAVRRDLSEVESSEGGDMIEFYEGNEVRKATVTYFGSIGKAEIDYYLNEGQIFFIFRKDTYYDKPTYMEGFQVDHIDENRFYIYENSLIKWINEKKEEVLPSSLLFKEKEKEVLNAEFFSENTHLSVAW